MSRRYDCSDPRQRADGLADAAACVRRGELVVMPTDTVYGIGANAFLPEAVQALLDAKGRDRQMPAPVLVGSVRAASALIDDLGTFGQDLLDEFWPGPLTVVCRANPSLSWDLGETKGTVAVRMPLHDLALELLRDTGPMAVSSANLTGGAPARTAAEAEEAFGDAIAVYLDGGVSGDLPPSTIVDLTGTVPRLLRAGAIPEKKLKDVLGVLVVDGEDEAEGEAEGGAEHAEHAESAESVEKPEEAQSAAKAEDAAGVQEPAEAKEPAETEESPQAPAAEQAGGQKDAHAE
ncbi:MAG TPA: L-threonylcarbamoyladenylate synthase [Streptosporangiaceae bacterium]